MKSQVWEQYFYKIDWDGLGFTPREIRFFHIKFGKFFYDLTTEEQMLLVGLMAAPRFFYNLIKNYGDVLVEMVSLIIMFGKWAVKKLKEFLKKFEEYQRNGKAEKYAKEYSKLLDKIHDVVDVEYQQLA
jgi:hypothetical protein